MKEKITKVERQLISLEKGIRNIRKLMTTMIREISPKSRQAVKDLQRPGDRPAKIDRTVSEDVVAVLKTFSVTKGDSGWKVYPPYPPYQTIASKTWQRIKEIMSDNGGDWMAQRQAFVFEEDPTPLFNSLLTGKVANRKKDLQAFFTPEALARKVVDLADVKGMTVLEPSAGQGAIAREALRAGAKEVICFEIDRHNFDKLRSYGLSASCCDFLEVSGNIRLYDSVLMNPPFAKKAFVKHILHALTFLRPGGKLVAIIPGDMPPKELTRKLPNGSSWNLIPLGADAFRESGTNVKTSILSIKLNS